MRSALAAAVALLIAPVAHAGGVGLIGTVGAHTESVYYYSNVNENGDPYTNIDDYDQFSMTQKLLNAGGGLEFVLGDRDDMILGSARFYYLNDAPPKDPAEITTEVDPDNVVAAIRENGRALGIGMVGLNWGIVEFAGDPGKLRFGATGHVGSAFLTRDHTEFLSFDIGPSITYKASRQVHIFTDVLYQGRFRKGWSHSGNLVVGARYFFD